MSQSLKALLPTNGNNWAIGESKNMANQANSYSGAIMLKYSNYNSNGIATVFDYNGMKILYRGAQYTALQSDFPDFYAQCGTSWGSDVYATRTLTGQTAVRFLDSNGAVLVTVGDGGKISRSTDGGVTWSSITSPTTANLKIVRYIPTLNQWIAPSGINSMCISSDDGVSWTNFGSGGGGVSGLTYDITALTAETVRMEYIGTYIVLCTGTKTFVSTNGKAWTEVLVGAGTQRRLTIGNGYFVVLYVNGANTCQFQYSTDGSSWSSAIGVAHSGYSQESSVEYGYGLIYNGTRWLWACGYTPSVTYQSSYPTSGPTPPSGTFVYPGTYTPTLWYTANGDPGSASNTVYYSTPDDPNPGWTGQGGNPNWFINQSERNRYIIGPSSYTFRQTGVNYTCWALLDSTNNFESAKDYDFSYWITNKRPNGPITSAGDPFTTMVINGGNSGHQNWSALVLPKFYCTANSYYWYGPGGSTIRLSGSITNPSIIIAAAAGTYTRLA